MTEKNVYLNGAIVPASQAKIGISDSGFLHGASAFTTMLAHNAKVFRLDAHLRRLTATVARFSLRAQTSSEELRRGVAELLEANGLSDARVRITLTPGEVGAESPTTLITAEALPEYPRRWYEQGMSVGVSSFKQSAEYPTTGFKTGCFFPRVLALQEAASKGLDEAIWYTSDNHLAEACFCNVFLVLCGEVRTPPLDMPVLGGIVREAVIELCEPLKLQCDDRTLLTVNEMLAADEVFLTSSCSGVRPVVRVEGHGVGDEKPGPVTRRIMSAYRDLLEDECPAPQERKVGGATGVSKESRQ